MNENSLIEFEKVVPQSEDIDIILYDLLDTGDLSKF